MRTIERDEAVQLIRKIFPALVLNGIEQYEYNFIQPVNPVIERNKGRLIFKTEAIEITLDIYDNSPAPWTFFKLKVKANGRAILVQTGEYDNISYKVARETDYYQEEELKRYFFDSVIFLE